MQISERIYNWLLKLYPASYTKEFGTEMQFVFTQSLREITKRQGKKGLLNLWSRTLIDVSKTVITQHIEIQKGTSMKNNPFIRVPLVTALILSIPFIAMQFTNEVTWDLGDFFIIGILIMLVGFLLEYISRNIQNNTNRVLISIGVVLLFLWIWAELAVGIFTTIGS